MKWLTPQVPTVSRGLLLLLLLVQGCGVNGSTVSDDTQRELNRQRRQWEAQDLANYRYTGRRICFCMREAVGPVLVEVREGTIASLTDQESGEPVGENFVELWPSIDGVFGLVQDAIDREAAEITVEYDAERGFPTSVSIDYIEEAVDDELGFTVEAFEVTALP